jgi:hypothetical protein
VITSVEHSLDTREQNFLITGPIESARTTEGLVFAVVSKTRLVNTKPIASSAAFPVRWNTAVGTLDQLAPDAAQGTFDFPCFSPDDKKLLLRGGPISIYDLAARTFVTIATGNHNDWKPLPRSPVILP